MTKSFFKTLAVLTVLAVVTTSALAGDPRGTPTPDAGSSALLLFTSLAGMGVGRRLLGRHRK
jgi:hypothetical protein